MVNDQEHKRSAANVLGTALDKNLSQPTLPPCCEKSQLETKRSAP